MLQINLLAPRNGIRSSGSASPSRISRVRKGKPVTEPESDEPADSESPGASFKQLLESLGEEAKEFTRRRPLESVLLSFVAGMILSDLLRRGR